MAGHDDVGLEPFELRQDLDPPFPVGVWVEKDREELVLDKIAREEDAPVGHPDDLVAAGVRGPLGELDLISSPRSSVWLPS